MTTSLEGSLNGANLLFAGKCQLWLQGDQQFYLSVKDDKTLEMTTDPGPNSVFAFYLIQGQELLVLQQMNVGLGNPLFVAFQDWIPLEFPFGNQLAGYVVEPWVKAAADAYPPPTGFAMLPFAGLALSQEVQSAPLEIPDTGYVWYGKDYFYSIHFDTSPYPLGDVNWNVTIVTTAVGGPGADFRYAFLQNYDGYARQNGLAGADFTGADLTNADFGETNLSQAKLANAILTGAIFNCVMRQADLSGATFSPATSFQSADLSGATFSIGAVLDGADFSGAIFNGVNAAGVSLRGANLESANLSHGAFTGADFTGATFNAQTNGQAAKLAKSILSNTTIRGDFSGADLTGANLTNTNFENVDLSGADFTGATFENTSFTGSKLEGTIFNQADLTTVTFDPDPFFTRDSTTAPTQFIGATVPASSIGFDWSYLVLSDATISNLPAQLSTEAQKLNASFAILDRINGKNLTHTSLQYADFTSASLGELDMSYADLSNAQLVDARFSGANLTGATMTAVNASSAQFGGISALVAVPASDLADAQQDLNTANIAALQGLFQQLGPLLSCDVQVAKTAASWTVNDSGTNATYSVVKMTQSGDAPVIMLCLAKPVAIDTTLFPNAETSLDNANGSDVFTLFNHYQVDLSAPGNVSITLQTAAWTVTDHGNNKVYTVRKDLNSQGLASMSIYTAATKATLTNAYLPNANLTDANLYAVSAHGCHIYGDNATLSGAILAEADFTGANLGGMNLEGVQMQGAVLDNAVLINASLKNANLMSGSNGLATSLVEASLQGADFTNAQLYGANLTGAAVAVPVPGGAKDTDAGVYLTTLASGLAADLDAAENVFSLNPDGDVAVFLSLLDALQRENIEPLVAPFQKNNVTLSNSASLQAIETNDAHSLWQIRQGGTTVYTVWVMPDENGYNELYVTPVASPANTFSLNPDGNQETFQTVFTALEQSDVSSLTGSFAAVKAPPLDPTSVIVAAAVVWGIVDGPHQYTVWAFVDTNAQMEFNVRASLDHVISAFRLAGYALRPQTLVKYVKAESSDQAKGIWVLDNDSLNPQNLSLGYGEFQVVDDSLDVYGTSIRIERLSDNEQSHYLEIDETTFAITKLDASNFSQDTTCPNGTTLQVNGPLAWDLMMRAPKAPPPPSCVPSDFWCPSSVVSTASVKPRVPWRFRKRKSAHH